MSDLDIKVVEERQNPLIGRRELKVVVTHVGRGTPSRYELRQRISELYKAPLECVYVVNVSTRYGQGLSMARVHVYNDPARAEEIEDEHVKRRNAPPGERGEEGGE